MSLLAIQLPPRRRLGPRAPAAEAAAAPEVPGQWAHVFSADGRSAGALRVAATHALPKADQVVLVVAASDVGWHHARLPVANAARMRLALLGTLEEQLLEDEGAVHLALAAGSRPGQDGWVAATHGPTLKSALAALEAAGVVVTKISSGLPPPGDPVRSHFSHDDPIARLQWPTPSDGATPEESGGQTRWTLSTADGAWHLPLPAPHHPDHGARPPPPPATGRPGGADARHSPGHAGNLAEALRNSLPAQTPQQRTTCTPAAAAEAERFMGRPVLVQTAAEHLLESALSTTDLRQFELQPRHRGLAVLRSLNQQLARREWRNVRVGLVVLVVLQLIGLNAAAWTQQQTLQARRDQINQLLLSSFPAVKTVLDAPAQMRAQTLQLRMAAGQPSPGDLAPALAAAAAVWPEGKPAVGAIRYEASRLTLSSPGWQETEAAALRQRLSAMGWTLDLSGDLLSLQHTSTAAP